MCAQKIESFDISKKQQAILQWKYAKRIQLRQKYLKECLNPSMQVMPVDSAVQRLISLRHNHDYVSNIKLMPHLFFSFMLLGGIYCGALILEQVKGAEEKLYRTGQVAYADREFKFA
ncbi:uncharacterized protein LOC132915521 [Bombus pascuorum]|uniref:uncharacterized protein LOC132915521 n=1 Tax=Bombus pascuorum TaxID=65598 RepID=UPI0021334732|nr:uncharacterized protein LOC132915521 [Bombus pascuorum]